MQISKEDEFNFDIACLNNSIKEFITDFWMDKFREMTAADIGTLVYQSPDTFIFFDINMEKRLIWEAAWSVVKGMNSDKSTAIKEFIYEITWRPPKTLDIKNKV